MNLTHFALNLLAYDELAYWNSIWANWLGISKLLQILLKIICFHSFKKWGKGKKRKSPHLLKYLSERILGKTVQVSSSVYQILRNVVSGKWPPLIFTTDRESWDWELGMPLNVRPWGELLFFFPQTYLLNASSRHSLVMWKQCWIRWKVSYLLDKKLKNLQWSLLKILNLYSL